MSIWEKAIGLFTGGIDETIKEVGDAIDKNVTSEQDRLKLRNELAQIEATAKNNIEGARVKLKELEAQVYKDLVADRASARGLGAEWVKSGRQNKRQDRLAYLSVLLLIALVVATLWLVKNSDMNDSGVQAAFALLNLITGGVLKTVNDVYGYEFGGSSGSDTKTGMIENVLQSFTGRKREGDR